jgi:hypothetical protein
MTYTIESITTKTVTTKYGPKPAYSIKAGGEWFNYGFKKPTFNEGDEVDFKYSETSYGKEVDGSSVRLISKGEGKVAGPSSTAPVAPSKPFYGPSPKVFPIPPLHGDRAIVRQNSITNATKLVMDSIGVAGAGSVTPAATFNEIDFESMAQKVIDIARMFEAYSCGDLDLAEAMKED